MDSDILREIIEYSIYAPSGDNSQPWQFKIKENKIFVYNVPEKDTSLYNFLMSASLISIGALVENIKIASSYYGYRCEVSLDEDISSNLVALCTLIKDNEILQSDLFKYIKERKTNRKPYKKEKLSSDFINEAEKIRTLYADEYSTVDFKIQNKVEAIDNIAFVSSLNEQIVLENKALHDFLFSHITWTEEEDKQKKGFFIKTLEIKGFKKFIFKILKSWKVLSILNKVSISKLVSRDNAKIYSHSGAMLSIVTDNKLTKNSFIKTGMLMQKLWLIATKYDMYMQPLTGIIFLNYRISINSNNDDLEKRHIEIIKDSYNIIKKEMEINHKEITILLRVGYADVPSGSTKRISPTIEF